MTELGVLPAAKGYHDMSSRELSAAAAAHSYSSDDESNEQKGTTRHDRADMTRMGKVQELKVSIVALLERPVPVALR